MSSISVRFNSFLFSYSIFNERNALAGSEKWRVKSEEFWLKTACGFLPYLFTITSYLFPCRLRRLVGLDGLEPSTSRLSGVRSNHLSYAPNMLWWRWGGSNSWPPACKAGALPAELHPHNFRDTLFFFFLLHPQNWTMLSNWILWPQR